MLFRVAESSGPGLLQVATPEQEPLHVQDLCMSKYVCRKKVGFV